MPGLTIQRDELTHTVVVVEQSITCWFQCSEFDKEQGSSPSDLTNTVTQ